MCALHQATRPVPEVDFAPVDELVWHAFPGASRALVWQPMPGGASTRHYFRALVPGAAVRSVVGMFVPDGARPEEIAKDGPSLPATRWPFLEVRDLLASRGIDVPTVYGEDTARGWILLEDLGDETLAVFLASHPACKEALYARAVADLARAQKALATLPAGSILATRAFGVDLLLSEIHHFREWALEARGVVMSPSDREAFDGIAGRLARRIAAAPRAFVHRDYQSRNLMIRRDHADWRSISWIDFQDALIGPRVYDLVALLNDSHQTFDASFVAARLDEYAQAFGIGAPERNEMGRQFDRVTVQRKLKDAGRFVFIDKVKQNSSFLKFVDPTIAKVRASLSRLHDEEDMRALSELLARVLRG